MSYDRPGIGHSNPSQVPRHASNMSLECHSLIVKEKIPTPIVFVTHGFGSHIARMFYRRWPEMVAGMVFIDPMHSKYILDQNWMGKYTEDYLSSSYYQAMAMTGLMEIYLKLSSKFWERQLDHVPKDVQSHMKYFMLKPQYWSTRREEMGEMVPSCRQIASLKEDYNIPILVIQSDKREEVQREMYTHEDQFNQELISLTKGPKQLMKYKSENFYTILESENVQKKILEFIKSINKQVSN